ncbi:MAG: N-acylglucosamine 2-epimerase, partial [Caulobacteraceae bacterium]|nr:N-acylglucosamine 2-epimerase [Caulobacteraceae bacterium]
MSASLAAAAAFARQWLFDEALPLWAERGLDPAGGFHDQLDDTGQPVAAPKRARVQAR